MLHFLNSKSKRLSAVAALGIELLTLWLTPVALASKAPYDVPINTEGSCSSVFDSTSVVLEHGRVMISRPETQRGYLRTNRTWSGVNGYLGSIEGSRPLDLENLRGKRVLDVGTGDGAFVTELRQLGIEADGLDIILRPEQRAQNFFIEADVLNTGLPDESYDLVVSTCSIFHYHESHEFYLNAVREILRITRSGGQILLIETTKGLPEIFEFASQVEFISPPPQYWPPYRPLPTQYNHPVLLKKK